MCLLLILGTFFLPAFRVDADATNATGTLGVCNIQDPTFYNTTEKPASAYNRVYFGKAASQYSYNDPSISNQPIYWRVLNTTANNNEKTPALFMLTEYAIIPAMTFGSSTSYSSSTVKTYLTNNVLPNFFSSEEQSNIMYTTKNAESDIKFYNTSGCYAYDCALNNDKIFLMSTHELIKREYGFNDYQSPNSGSAVYQSDYNRRTSCYPNGSNVEWWLRSKTAHLTFVGSGGNLGDVKVKDKSSKYLRFALNIPLASILFASNAASQTPTPLSTFYPIPSELPRNILVHNGNDNDSSGSKLTIVDTSRTNSFSVDTSNICKNPGEIISLNYSGAVAQGNNGTEYLSAIIKEVGTNGYGGNGLYHARLMEVRQNTSGNLSMTIPQDITPGDYILIVYNELDRGEYKTNYAGYARITLHVPPPPKLTSIYKNESGNILKLTISGEDLSHISTLLGEKILNIAGDNTTNNLNLSENTTGIIVHDHHSNSTSKYTNDIAIDKTPPYVTVTRSGGTYTITVSDNESGVWKITNGDGTKVYHDYS